MEKRWSASPFSSLPVLPPIITEDRDRAFLLELNEWITQELTHVDAVDTRQHYVIYKQVFSKVGNSR